VLHLWFTCVSPKTPSQVSPTIKGDSQVTLQVRVQVNHRWYTGEG